MKNWSYKKTRTCGHYLFSGKFRKQNRKIEHNEIYDVITQHAGLYINLVFPGKTKRTHE